MNDHDVHELIEMAQKQGRRMLIVEYGKNAGILTTENPKMIADQIGEAIAMAVKIFHGASQKDGPQLTEKDVFDAVIYAAFSRANKLLGSESKLKAQSA
jgi:hypothetical protein